MYDKYINNMKSKALCIGLCYDFQLLNAIPTEPHDKPLDLILTDKRFIKI
jgi:5-formyltetrahydrofolate cyclo-ligase